MRTKESSSPSTPPPSSSTLSPVKQALVALKTMKQRYASLKAEKNEPIAIIGMGCRFPGAVQTPEAYWDFLKQGRSGIVEVPPERWDIDACYDSDPDKPGTMYCRHGGFLGAVDGFDPLFFGLSHREAARMDPQHRLILEVAWETLEQAQIPPSSLHGTPVGVFIGSTAYDYGLHLFGQGDLTRVDAFSGTGGTLGPAAGRLSYLLGLTGPSLVLDTACSSSLVAVHLACQSLRMGECTMALVGGVNLTLDPAGTINFCKARMLAPDGHCKTFDAAANGYVRGEGCGMVLLKKISDVAPDKDRVLAVIQGSALNQDGPSGGFTVPSGPAQQKVIRSALTSAGVSPNQIHYIEAHGTGTSLGDPIEVEALGELFGPDRDPESPLRIGSVKTNVGHLEAAAGMASLIKVILSIQHGQIPPHLHFKTPNPKIQWDRLPIAVNTDLTPWPESDRGNFAGISCFGFSGTNAHLIVGPWREKEKTPSATVQVQTESTPSSNETSHLIDGELQCFCLSARSRSALHEVVNRWLSYITAHPDERLDAICRSANAGREHFSHRLAILAASLPHLRELLQTVLDDQVLDNKHKSESERGNGSGSGSGSGNENGNGNGNGNGSKSGSEGESESEKKNRNGNENGKPPYAYAKVKSNTSTIFGDQRPIASKTDAKTLADAYLKGLPIQWDALHNGTPTTPSDPPFYPFERNRCWIETPSTKGKHPTAFNAGLSPSVDPTKSRPSLQQKEQKRDLYSKGTLLDHPLLGNEIDLPLLDQIRFQNHWSPNHPPHLQDHRLFDRAVVPAADYVAQLLTAAQWRGIYGAITLKDLIFAQPLFLNDLDGHPDERQVQLILDPIESKQRISSMLNPVRATSLTKCDDAAKEGDAHFEKQFSAQIISCERFSKSSQSESSHEISRKTIASHWETHCRGKVSWSAESPLTSNACLPSRPAEEAPDLHADDAPDLHAVQQRCTVVQDRAAFYTELEQSGYHWGPSFRWLDTLWKSDTEALFKIVHPDLPDNPDDYPVYPGFLDTGFQVLGTFGHRDQGMDTSHFIAFAITEMVWLRPIDYHSTWGYLRITQPALPGGTHFKGDLTWMDAKGVALLIKGFEFRKINRDIQPQSPSASMSGMLWNRSQITCPQTSPPNPLSMNGEGENGSVVSRSFLYQPVWERKPFPLSHPSHGTPRLEPHWDHGIDSERSNQWAVGVWLILSDGWPIFPSSGKDLTQEHEDHEIPIDQKEIRTSPSPSLGSLLTDALQKAGGCIVTAIPQHSVKAHSIQFQAIKTSSSDQADSSGSNRDIDRYAMDPAKPDHFKELVKRVDKKATQLGVPVRGILHLWSLDDPVSEFPFHEKPDENGTASFKSSSEAFTDQQAIDVIQDRGGVTLIHLIQAHQTLSRKQRPQTPHWPLWVVTRGAQPVTSGNPLPGSLNTPLWGMATSLNLELPNSPCTCIDLTPGSTLTSDATKLLDELAYPGSERQIALGDTGRFVKRLVPFPFDLAALSHLNRDGRDAAPHWHENNASISTIKEDTFAPDNVQYLITGGLGALGMLTADYLISQGARHLILIGRQKPGKRASQQITAWRNQGVQVMVESIDITSKPQVTALFESIHQSPIPLAGIVHAAGTLDDGMLIHQTRERFHRVLAPKLSGTLNLCACIDKFYTQQSAPFILFYSSLTALTGAPGQTGYGAANAFLDAMAHHLRSRGLSALSINFGPWKTSGMAARQSPDIARQWQAVGITPLDASVNLALVGHAVNSLAPTNLDDVRSHTVDDLIGPNADVLPDRNVDELLDRNVDGLLDRNVDGLLDRNVDGLLDRNVDGLFDPNADGVLHRNVDELLEHTVDKVDGLPPQLGLFDIQWERFVTSAGKGVDRALLSKLLPKGNHNALPPSSPSLDKGKTDSCSGVPSPPNLDIGETNSSSGVPSAHLDPSSPSSRRIPEKKGKKATEGMIETLCQTAACDRLSFITTHVCNRVAKILNLPDNVCVDPEESLFDYGLTSLMAIELKDLLETDLNHTLPTTFAFDFPTVQDMCASLLECVDPLLDNMKAPLHDDLSEKEENRPTETKSDLYGELTTSIERLDERLRSNFQASGIQANAVSQCENLDTASIETILLQQIETLHQLMKRQLSILERQKNGHNHHFDQNA